MEGAWTLGRVGRDGAVLRVTTWALAAVLAIGGLAAWTIARTPFRPPDGGGPHALLLGPPPAQLPPPGWVLAGGVLVALVVLGSILLHELGHLAGARLARVRVTAIDLTFYGGLASFEDDDPGAARLATIALGGPVVTAVLTAAFGAATAALGPATSSAGAVADRVATIGLVVNAFALVVNFVPVQPLDGALLLRALRARR